MKTGVPFDGDGLEPRTPIDRVAARVTGAGERFSGYSLNTEERCSITPFPTRPHPGGNELPHYEGTKVGKLTVVGLATIEYTAGYIGQNRMLPKRANEKRARASYKGSNPQKFPTRNTGSARWVCRCVCGNYTLRSSRGLRKNADSEFPDACVQCRQLDKQRNGFRKGLEQPTGR